MDDAYCLLHGDCRERMQSLHAESVDSIVTDPPYGLAFMGKDWDHGVPGVAFWTEALRVAKPGAHLLAFGGTRTHHRLACAIEDAGWEVRDCIMWVYGSGFPKSLDVSKAIDKAAGAEREVVGDKLDRPGYHLHPHNGGEAFGHGIASTTYQTRLKAAQITAPATDAARQWAGWGTALKPAWEPIIVARKPLCGTVAENVLRYGTGGINVEACRVGGDQTITIRGKAQTSPSGWISDGAEEVVYKTNPPGRWPANVMHDGNEEVVSLFPQTTSGTLNQTVCGNGTQVGQWGKKAKPTDWKGDSGSAARFFYCAKASKADRDEGNGHPTVKPTALMRYLCRLVTQPKGVVLDPFMGSGSTGKAAMLEGFRFIGIEREAEYVEIARRRINAAHAIQFAHE